MSCTYLTLYSLLLRVIFGIFNEIEESIGRSTLLEDLKLSKLIALHNKCIELVTLLVNVACNFLSFTFFGVFTLCSQIIFPCNDFLHIKVEGNEEHHCNVVITLQDMFEIITTDMMINGSR